MNINDVKAYELLQKRELQGIHSAGYLLRHKKSGARVLLIENDDDNKVFQIGFRTPPSDSTGVPHIMEHSVLCGSKNFPAKDPFVELVKGSLNTFLNAMTYPDKTVYPVASCNDKDFQNLMHIYMDAVLYPNIYKHEEIFRQEGWSYQMDSLEDPLTYNGVVYNEMKGAFSSPESVLDRVVLNVLFPDTSYAYESGGDPEDIPNLTYEQFLDFHRTYYHPSNSFIYLYGDMDMAEKLNWLDEEYLSHFEAKEIDSRIRLQEPFSKVKEEELTYSIGSEESEEENTFLSYNKVVGTTLDPKLYLAFEILDYALLSAPGAPLKKALTDAGIGKDIMGAFDNGVYQPIFSVVSKNADASQKEAFVSCIEEVLRDIVKNGMDEKALEAGINYQEFRYREADFGNCPKGLAYGLLMLDSWLYDDNEPFMHVEALDTFDFLKKQIGTRYYEELIQKYILDNTHGAIVVVKPEKGRTAKLEKELEEKLAAYKESLNNQEKETLVAHTKALEAYQSAEDSPEDLEKIPVLAREDIAREVQPIYNEELCVADVPVIYHEVETNGIGYVDIIFDMSDVEEEDLPYVGILRAALGVIDTKKHDYGELFNEINMRTGGIGTSLELYNDVTKVKERVFKPTFEIKAKALYDNLSFAFEMMGEILTESRLDDTKRIKEILAMLKSRLTMKFQSSGHVTAALRALSYASPSAKLKDLTSGIDFYRKVEWLDAHFEEEKENLSLKLQQLSEKLFCKERMILSYTAAREGLNNFEKMLASLNDRLYKGVKVEKPCVICLEKKNEGFKTASKVQYVARAGNFIEQGEEYTGALQILKVILSYEYLWQNVRVKGGAYGCMSNFNRVGEGYFVSYRDPNLKKTMDIYEGVVEYVKNFDVSDRDMTKYIIGTMSNLDQPMTPATKGDRSMNLYMNKVDEAMLQKTRNEVLDATKEDIRKLAPILEAVLKAEQLCVIGSEEKIEEAKDLFDTVTNFQNEGEKEDE
ncbi:MAG: insulinase family protein [Lachnospiraceae bacterium]|nr:insulinase family protein [Lachnospiraceae bacterium]